MKRLMTALALVAVSAGAAFAHGDEHHAANWGQPGDPKKVTRTVTIEATEIKYNTDKLTFKVGETVKFVFVNKGQQNHEFMIADAAEQQEHRQMMQDMAGMSVDQMHHEKEANMVDTKPGETKELVWTFTTAGTFEFACNYPGHAEVGMAGTIVVQ